MFGKRHKLKYEFVENQDEDTLDLDPIKKKCFTPNCLWSSLFTTVLIVIYYIPSIGSTFYQRWLYQSFHFPLGTVMIHMMVKFILASIIRWFLIRKQGKPRILLGWREYIMAIAPTGIFSGIDISFSNWGLELITVSLYTMTKSTTIIFILGFSILFKLEKKSWSLCVIVTMITVGLILFTYKATQFNTLGFILLLLASMSSGIRWTCVQMLLQKSKMGMRNPVDMIYHMQPWMVLSVLPFFVWMEASTVVKNCQLFRFIEFSVFANISCKILIGALLAFFMEFSEVMLVTYTSSLTLAIAGIFKEVFMLVLAVEWNGDQMSAVNVTGLLLCLLGIVCHVHHKLTTMSPKLVGRDYEPENEHQELGDYLIEQNLQYEVSSDSDGDRSDTQVIFDILNKHDR